MPYMLVSVVASPCEIPKSPISLVKQGHRLVYYKHTNFTGFEFYNLDEDSEELNDLFPSKPALAIQMKAELLQKIEEFNRPYRK